MPVNARPGSDTFCRAWLPILLLLGGLWLRAPSIWNANPLDVDEALYATYARYISHENSPLLNGIAVDKPPLSFYVTALSFKLFRDPSDWAARLPNFYASILNLAVMWTLTRVLYRQCLIAMFAMLFAVLSSFDIAFSGTVFTDPLATLWILLACLAISRRRWGWAGIAAGLAFITKQSSLQYLPLVLLLGIAMDTGLPKAALTRLLAGAGLIGILPFIWQGLRSTNSPDWWILGAVNNDPGRLVRSSELLPRLHTWLGHLTEITSGPVLLAFTGVFVISLLAAGRHPSRTVIIDLGLSAYAGGYLFVYWLVGLNTYDRYLHILTPLFGLLLGRGLWRVSHYIKWTDHARTSMLLTILLLFTMAPTALQARHGNSLLNEVQERHTDIVATAAYLNTLPPGTIVYDHWLGWQLRWYTGLDRPPGMWLRITYYPTVETLVRDANRNRDLQPRYFVVPDWAPEALWIEALSTVFLTPEPVQQFGHFIIYRLDLREHA
jgi:4-amino-4-deoxy-L-arabinose transferase-like glycosyltransferase